VLREAVVIKALALIDGDLRWTYQEWLLRIGALQQSLVQLGLQHGDHLVSVLQNRQEAATLHWACQFAGVVMTPLNWRAKPEEVHYALQDRQPNWWCTRASPVQPCCKP